MLSKVTPPGDPESEGMFRGREEHVRVDLQARRGVCCRRDFIFR